MKCDASEVINSCREQNAVLWKSLSLLLPRHTIYSVNKKCIVLFCPFSAVYLTEAHLTSSLQRELVEGLREFTRDKSLRAKPY